MSVLYEQKMDTKTIDELKETFTRLFWLSHTYTYNFDDDYRYSNIIQKEGTVV